MALKLMYITNNPEIAIIAENAGVDRIFVDMEYIGKQERQGGMNTVQNHHTIADVIAIKKAISKAELLVRCNPIHERNKEYISSKEEINGIINAGADIVMLPFFKTIEEVNEFISIVNSRCKVMLLIETPEAVNLLDKILEIPGIDYIHIGINDLSLGYGKKFMFELLANGVVESICKKIKKKRISFGFGGIASLENGIIPGKNIIMEHYRIGSTCAILSRSFCDYNLMPINDIRQFFDSEMEKIRNFELFCEKASKKEKSLYKNDTFNKINKYVEKLYEKN